MLQEILQSVKLLLIIPGIFASMLALFFIGRKLMALVSPLTGAFWSLAVAYIFFPVGQALKCIKIKIYRSILWAGQLLQPLARISFAVLYYGIRFLAMAAGSSLLWLLVWSLWSRMSAKPFIPLAIAAILIGVPVAILFWLIYLYEERKFSFRILGLAIASGIQIIAPIIAFLPLLGTD